MVEKLSILPLKRNDYKFLVFIALYFVNKPFSLDQGLFFDTKKADSSFELSAFLYWAMCF